MPESVMVYATGGPSHRETPSRERDAIEWRPMPMPTVRKPRAAVPWHNIERDPSGGRHRVTRRVHAPTALAAALADADDFLGGAA